MMGSFLAESVIVAELVSSGPIITGSCVQVLAESVIVVVFISSGHMIIGSSPD